MALFAGNKSLGVYFITNYVHSLKQEEKEIMHKNVIKLLENEAKTVISKIYNIVDINEAISYYKNNASTGKVLIKF